MFDGRLTTLSQNSVIRFAADEVVRRAADTRGLPLPSSPSTELSLSTDSSPVSVVNLKETIAC